MNEPVMVIQTTLFTRDYNIELCMSKQPLYKVSFIFIEIDLYLWSLSNCKHPSLWPLLCKMYYTTVYFP